MTVVLTDELVRDTLRDVAAENPEKVYETPEAMKTDGGACYYVHKAEDGSEGPGCIVGTVLYRLGVPLAEMAKREGTNALGVIADLELSGEVEAKGLSSSTRTLLRWVQIQQDGGRSWGSAYKNATGEDVPLLIEV
ncbi:hypothetical protein [Streptomyces sp. NPDC004682]